MCHVDDLRDPPDHVQAMRDHGEDATQHEADDEVRHDEAEVRHRPPRSRAGARPTGGTDNGRMTVRRWPATRPSVACRATARRPSYARSGAPSIPVGTLRTRS